MATMAPVDSSPRGGMCGFELVCSSKASDAIPVHKYRSTNTGLTVYIAEVEGPVVAGYFCLVTEANDDDGLPHTLEHLIFLGSEDYPYKGVLDLLANRVLANGTNAATHVDYTFYTLTTAGSEGFLSLMPIYLEHILYPTLQKSAYVTEVHHVTGEGEDAGVVYCEKQGVENIGENLMFVELGRHLYPDSGYKSVYGGAMKNLRESTTLEKVRSYHKEFYRPENLAVVIAGQVKHSDVFKALQPIEEKIMSKGDRGPFRRPWQSPVSPLKESVDVEVLYPNDDETNGIVMIGYSGPKATTGLYDFLGCSMLLKYLSTTSVSPLQRDLVEIEDPYACNVRTFAIEYLVSLLCAMFEGVPSPKIPLVKERFLRTLGEVHANGIDATRMRTVIHREILERLSALESEPHDVVSQMLSGDIIYGNTQEDLERRLDDISSLRKLEAEPKSYWLDLLKKYLLDAPMVTVLGVPSPEKQRELTRQEKERVAERIETLGKEGLLLKDKELQEAVSENNRPIPDELLTAMPIPGTDSINFHAIKSYATDTREQHSKLDATRLPFFAYLDHVNTNFVYMFAIMDSAPVKRELRPYVPLLLEALLESPLKRGDRMIPHEEVVAELEADTVAQGTSVGFNCTSRFVCGPYSHCVQLMLQLELGKYEKGVQWLKEILHDVVMTAERLKIIATKIINDVAEAKRQGYKVATDLMQGLWYNKDSNPYSASMLRQHKFLTRLVDRLNDESGQKEVLAEIESVRRVLTAPEHTVLYLAANVDKLASHVPDLYAAWNAFLPKGNSTRKSKLNAVHDWTLMNLPEEIPISGCVTAMGCIDSMFFYQTCPCIKDYLSPDLAPLMVCLVYLTQTEGPMWRLIRGQGLAYTSRLVPKINEGLLCLILYRSINAFAAYKETKSIVDSHISEDKWEKLLFESAKSSLIFEFIDKEKSIGDLVVQSLLSYAKNVPHDYNQEMVRRVSAVTMEDVKRVAPIYLKPLFDPKQCKTTVVCHPSKAAELVASFKELNHELKLYSSLEETYLNDW